MNKHSFRLLPLAALPLILTACGGDDNKSTPLSEGSYAVQLVASDYSSSQVAVGNIIGDRTATQGLLSKADSDYTISTFGSSLYHIGRYGIDTIDRYDTAADTAFNEAIWSYSTNDAGDSTANTYKLVQVSDTKAYVIRYGANSIWEVNPSATSEADFKVAEIDMSEYTYSGDNPGVAPRMVDAIVVNGQLLVVMQRLDGWWGAQQAYVAVIDVDSNEEIDTDPQTDGLKGVALTVSNPGNLVEHNGTVYVAGRGNYGSNSGGIDEISTSSWEVTNLVNGETFADELNDVDNNIYYHITDVAVTEDNQLYLTANIEQGYTTQYTRIFELNPSTGVSTELDLNALTGINADTAIKMGDLNVDTNNRLWAAIRNSDTPGLVVIDTDTNTRSGDVIELDMPASAINFLSVE
ncbi:hypothetical protein [Parathalassolituus penaei]|uniref:Uncharacterized protein n=1 Tax=Parathalassolituus penaei TaxID=2997323 RepID=A0A9X3EAC0_9GAMM|nr:hypothetical protein [Parathalassolituus penaei]MCY0963867.1 hypothetical protein [Parathalassolituus penaei]